MTLVLLHGFVSATWLRVTKPRGARRETERTRCTAQGRAAALHACRQPSNTVQSRITKCIAQLLLHYKRDVAKQNTIHHTLVYGTGVLPALPARDPIPNSRPEDLQQPSPSLKSWIGKDTMPMHALLFVDTRRRLDINATWVLENWRQDDEAAPSQGASAEVHMVQKQTRHHRGKNTSLTSAMGTE